MGEFAWEELEDLFTKAVSLDGDEQVHFLDQECADQTRLRRQLDELLAADQQVSKTWPGLSFNGFGDTQDETDATDAVHLQIPGYRCVRRLGAGGMGIVYLALRQDEVFEGKAFAIKVLHSHRIGESAKKRFIAERRLLAALDHPGIVRIYDGGELADGRPYLVMDYVEGLSFVRYCDSSRLTVRQRLVLFREVCLALHHAHQNLVVHRDLKPSNILVDSEDVPHLLDFGIAKRLPRGVEDMVTTGFVPMTPAYASPEQIAGHSLTTASDLYSLGVILHELLVGGLPDSDEDSAKPSRYLAALSDLEDISVARRTTPARLRRQIEGDLDHIVAKLLRSEPEARYASARELAEDIDRHLADKPILARRGSWRYVTGRFLRRRRVGLLASCASLLVLVLATIAWVQSDRLKRSEAAIEERDRIIRGFTVWKPDTAGFGRQHREQGFERTLGVLRQVNFVDSATACRQERALLERRQEGDLSERSMLLSSFSAALMEIVESDPTGEAEVAASEALAIPNRESLEVLRGSVYGLTLSKVEDTEWLMMKGKAELIRVEELLGLDRTKVGLNH